MKSFLLIIFIGLASNVSSGEDPRFWDFNNDGVEDVWYEDKEQKYIEYLDRNFDGKLDSVTTFDAHSNWILGSQTDDDFDGKPETRHFYVNSQIHSTFIDSNGNDCSDIIHYYSYQVISKSLKVEASSKGKGSKITEVVYKFGFPEFSHTYVSEMSVCEFYEKELTKAPKRKPMPKIPSNSELTSK